MRSCPICYKLLELGDLKSVVTVVHPNYSVGDRITMNLHKVPRNSHSSVSGPSVNKMKIAATKIQVIIVRFFTYQLALPFVIVFVGS